MYLSKVMVRQPQAWFKHRRKHSDPLYAEHQMIWDMFANTPDQSRDFLYRREDQPGKLPFYYVLSARQPISESHDFCIQTKAFTPVLKSGDQLSFLLRVNAVVTRKINDHSKKRHRRDIIEAKVDEYKEKIPDKDSRPAPAIIQHEAAQQWLQARQEKHGFTADEFFVSNHQFHRLKKPGDNNIRHFTSLDLQGRIQVSDPEQLTAALYRGLGRSKAFGCGLLLVRRL